MSNIDIFYILININKDWLRTIVDFEEIENFILLSLVNKKEFSIQAKKNIYNLIVINKNLLLSKNREVD